ncbi:hypothetical protein Ddc_00390 [Ditylenchus destructor]|nr:hypothetical protein Ddc_00390 [Ditylenchus destructor]
MSVYHQEDLTKLCQFTTNRYQLRSQSKRPTHWAESQAYSRRAQLTMTILTDYRRSDEAVPVHHEPVPAEKPVEKTDTLGRITSLFKKSTAHEDYPQAVSYEGPYRLDGAEISGAPLTPVSYHPGRSDEAVPVHHEPVPAEKPVEKTDTLGRITSLFKKSTAHEDYPQALQYEGPTTRPRSMTSTSSMTTMSVYTRKI